MNTSTVETEEQGRKYLTRKELAERWQTSKSRLSALASAGTSPVGYVQLMPGGQVLYPLSEIEAYEAQCEANALGKSAA